MGKIHDKRAGRHNRPRSPVFSVLAIICSVLFIMLIVLAFFTDTGQFVTGKEERSASLETADLASAANPARETTASEMAESSPIRLGVGIPTVVWMSDTQHYSESYPHIFKSMTEWIVQHKSALDIRYVIHTGDIVDDRDQPAQWNHAEAALKLLDGAVPLFTIAGNHDISNESRIFDPYISIFGEGRFNSLPTEGGTYGDGIARYELLDMDKRKYILAGVSYHPDSEEIDWLNDVLAEHIDRTAILCVHSYMDAKGKLTTDGKQLLPNVVEKNPNVWLVLCGHMHGIYHSTVLFDGDRDGTAERTVYQLLFDYQDGKRGGNGYICLLGFDEDNGVLHVQTYSPYLGDSCYCDDGNAKEDFTIPMPDVS